MKIEPCYEKTMEVLESAERVFSEKYHRNDEKFADIKKICWLIDDLSKEFDCESVYAWVNPADKRLTIAIECFDLILENGRTHTFFTLLDFIDSFKFSKAEEDILRVEFNIENMWE